MKSAESKPANKAEMLSSELQLIKKTLLEQKSEILNKSQDFKKNQISSVKAADEVDAVVQNLQDNLVIQLHERDQMSLLLIDKALSKFSSGTYGQCEGCEDEIGMKRLQARPLACLCIACMEEQESPRNLLQ